ncbi:MAG: hypothetical protein DHS20C16_31280 [Phycisphaerae bacterium]|nr:MAG: hypothetical protein DHS20C16_31280 [Phycisphaerae bacterium]
MNQAADSKVETAPLTLGVISSIGVFGEGTQWYTHVSFGRVLNLLAPKFRKLVFLAKAFQDRTTSMDCELDCDAIEVRPGPAFARSIDALRRPRPLLRSYRLLVQSSDVVFIRGMNPFSWYIHWCCARYRKPISHWLVGNPTELLRMHSRFGGMKDKLALWYTMTDERLLKIMARRSRAAFVVNGAELSQKWRRFSPDTVVSSTISREESREREDTCQGASIRLLFVGFVRPEKGLEYLIRAMPLVKSERPLELSIVGDRDGYPAETQNIDRIIRELDLSEIVRWEGYARFGPELFDHLDNADILVLPSLSEGTPRVLVEGRARCVPIIATNVGGIPTSVRDSFDGLLVPPKAPRALADAITRVIDDGELRRSHIRNGFAAAKTQCVEDFTVELYESIKRAVRLRQN